MNLIRLHNKYDGKDYVRISKAKARKAFDAGETMYITPCNFNPFGYHFNMSIEFSKTHYTCKDMNFEKFVNEFTWYNCNKETGMYPAFYKEEK